MDTVLPARPSKEPMASMTAPVTSNSCDRASHPSSPRQGVIRPEREQCRSIASQPDHGSGILRFIQSGNGGFPPAR
jgi:hypothetical protein